MLIASDLNAAVKSLWYTASIHCYSPVSPKALTFIDFIPDFWTVSTRLSVEVYTITDDENQLRLQSNSFHFFDKSNVRKRLTRTTARFVAAHMSRLQTTALRITIFTSAVWNIMNYAMVHVDSASEDEQMTPKQILKKFEKLPKVVWPCRASSKVHFIVYFFQLFCKSKHYLKFNKSPASINLIAWRPSDI